MSEHKQPKKPEGLESPDDRLKVVPRPPKVGDVDKMAGLKIPTRRVRMFMVKPDDFMFLFTKGLKWRKNTRIVAGAPDDAQVIAVAPDSIRNGIMLVVQSATFDEIPINVLPPVVPIEIDVGVQNATKKKKAPRKKRK